MRLRAWLRSQEDAIGARWYQELMAGSRESRDTAERLLRLVVRYLVSILPFCFGDRRDAGLGAWEQAAHLYGSLAVRRGLAAGEVVEELQTLRNVILRLLLVDPSAGSSDSSTEALPFLDFLTLNRVLDLAVSRASVAYVDDLFFAHLQGSGVSEEITPELLEETERQLQAFRKELEA